MYKFLILIWCINVFSCGINNKKGKQEDLDKITSEVIMYLVGNKCFEYKSFGNDSIQNVISVSKQFVLKISDKDSVNDLDLKGFLETPQKFFLENDTFHISKWSDKKVIMSDWSDVVMGFDFQYELSKKINTPNRINSICTYVFSKPYVVESSNNYKILFKVMRFFERPVEYCYALVNTNKKFEINSIQCFQQKKQLIPLPPSRSAILDQKNNGIKPK